MQDNRLARLLPHLSLQSPVMRYAIRLTLAMLTARYLLRDSVQSRFGLRLEPEPVVV